MKRILFVLLDILSAAFLIGAYVIQYFTKNKLGMVRWVNFQERKTREAVPVDILKYAAVIVVLLLAVIIVREFLKKRLNLGRLDGGMVAVMVILVAGYLGATLVVTIEVTPAYFMVLPMIGAAALLQVIRSGIAVWTCRDEK